MHCLWERLLSLCAACDNKGARTAVFANDAVHFIIVLIYIVVFCVDLKKKALQCKEGSCIFLSMEKRAGARMG